MNGFEKAMLISLVASWIFIILDACRMFGMVLR
ncbi:hypothetical protein ATF84_1244 [[Clostridium] innocuum]|nr:hypothetical protein ATF84_1244 [[Clostridium] innocuum]SSA49131.1 hypothetical protein SAMN04487929_1244 [[Clostridium] innocuum]